MGGDPADCLKTRPERVALLGLGASRMAYGEHICATSCASTWDEVWTVNFGGRVYRHDKLWVFDDLRRQAQAMPAYGYFLATHDRPIITSTPYPEFPMSVRFPIEEVVQKIGDDFLNSTVAYAIAWAMVSGVKELWLYGCDFHYPNQDRKEEGGQCAAYLLGLARHFGMTFKLPNMSTLLAAYQAKPIKGQLVRPLYGYIQHPLLSADGDQPWAASPGEIALQAALEVGHAAGPDVPADTEMPS